MWLIRRVNWHEVIDERNFEMDQVIAGVLESCKRRLKSAARGGRIVRHLVKV